jgi:hypothetical protein
MKIRILFGAAMIATGLVATTGIASAHPVRNWPIAYTCTGGDFTSNPPNLVNIPSGIYASITVKGACSVGAGETIRVLGNVSVASGGVLDAQSAPSTITVGQNVTAGPGSLLGLGCLPDPTATSTTGHPCTIDPTESSHITVYGNVSAWDADTVLLNGITVKRNVTLIGGGGATPWSIKTNTIRGSLIVRDVTPNWIGVLVNKIGGNVILTNIHITAGLPPESEPMPTIYIASNTVGWNLICWGLGPYVSGGFPGEVNVVGGHKVGQCADLPITVPPTTS